MNWRSGNNVGDRDADHPHWTQVLNDLATWKVKTVVPGHGDLGTVETLRAQSAFLDDLWKQVAAEEGGQDRRPAGRGSEPVETRRFRGRPAADAVGDPAGVPQGAGALTVATAAA